MTTLEIVHLRLTWKATDELVEDIRETLGGNRDGLEVRVFRHARFQGDLRVHLYRGEGRDEASVLGDRLASMLRKHGMVEHSVWVEATGDAPG